MDRNIIARIPDQVAEELGESPASYEYQRDRLQAAEDAGWLERAVVDFSRPGVSDAVDRTRKRIAALSADDVSEDEIEKADTVLTGLAYQYSVGGSNRVTVVVSDRIAERAIDDVLSAMGVNEWTSVIDGRAFLKSLVADEW